MVANTECQFRKEFYSVSTKIVCEVGHGSMEKTGEIQVNINGQHGTSTNEVQFTYQVSVYAGYVLCICVYVYIHVHGKSYSFFIYWIFDLLLGNTKDHLKRKSISLLISY
uniref:IPT/TIG domain-containing protein n=2 Tax=Micrurus lemniscatus lemniscatus TaxID=129467 RepID=A0A2D4J918_MICLE